MTDITMNEYELKALRFAERYGIFNYEVQGTEMTYTEVFRTEGTYKAVVDLKTMKETRKQI